MEAWIKAATPGEPHAWLATLAGTWRFEGTFWSAPGTEPSKSQGTAERAMLLGLVFFASGARRGRTGAERTMRNAAWMAPWLGGHVLLGWLGRYGGRNLLPDWIDLAVVIGFSLTIFYTAVALSLDRATAEAAVAKDAEQLQY